MRSKFGIKGQSNGPQAKQTSITGEEITDREEEKY
jgi:hypothetical protein